MTFTVEKNCASVTTCKSIGYRETIFLNSFHNVTIFGFFIPRITILNSTFIQRLDADTIVIQNDALRENHNAS